MCVADALGTRLVLRLEKNKPTYQGGRKELGMKLCTFAHIGTASNQTFVLRSCGIYPSSHRQEAGRVPLGWVGDDLVKEVL